MCLCWVSSDSLPLFFLEWSHEFVYPRVSSTAGHALNSLDLFSSLLVWLICVWDCRCAAPIGAVFQSRWSSAGCLSGMSSKPCPEIVWESTHKGLGEKRTGTILMKKYSWWCSLTFLAAHGVKRKCPAKHSREVCSSRGLCDCFLTGDC